MPSLKINDLEGLHNLEFQGADGVDVRPISDIGLPWKTV
jgi:hypothetical protein